MGSGVVQAAVRAVPTSHATIKQRANLTTRAVTEQTASYRWTYDTTTFDIPCEVSGSGARTLLMVPAISSVSCRDELRPLAAKLSSKLRCYLTDWPGYGNTDRQSKPYSAEMCSDFAAELMQSSQLGANQLDIVAAGHGVGMIVHALEQLKKQDKLPAIGKLVLVAPTIQGPLAVMGMSDGFRNNMRNALQTPVVGDVLYSALSSESNVLSSLKSHVLTTERLLTEDFLAARGGVARKPFARWGEAAFVSGGLDLYPTPEGFGQALASLGVPTLVILGQQYPRRSGASIRTAVDEAQKVAGELVNLREVPGALGLYEEFADEVYGVVADFLGVN